MSTSYLVGSSMGNPTTVDGQRIPHENHLNGVAIGGFVVIGVLFLAFMYLYISPLLRKPVDDTSQKSDTAPTDTEAGGDLDPVDKSILLAWIHRRSRGRFADTTGNNQGSPRQDAPPFPPKLEARSGEKRTLSFFSRISIVPHFAFPLAPPPIYSSRPPTPLEARTPSDASLSMSRSNCTAAPAISSPLVQQPCQMPAKRSFPPTYGLSLRSNSSPGKQEAGGFLNRVSIASLGSQVVDTPAKTSHSTSDSTLYPGWISRIQPSSNVMSEPRNCIQPSRNEEPSAMPRNESNVKKGPQKGASRARLTGAPF